MFQVNRRALALLTAVAAPLTLLSPVSAQTAEPRPEGAAFACQPGFYQVLSGQLNLFTPDQGNFEPVGPDYANYNAIGYRIADGMLYGMQHDQVIRIDANGVNIELGTVQDAGGSYTGDFGDDGLLYVSRGGRGWMSIDVDTLESTELPEMSASGGPADVANLYGTLYGVSSSGQLWIYDPVSRTYDNSRQISGLPSTNMAYGAMWATAGGNLYAGRNSGEIYQITGFSTDSPTATQVGTSDSTRSNDGASCSLAPPPEGIDDVDGPEPEVEPQTPEAKEAAEVYEQEQYVEPEPAPETAEETSSSEVPEEHAPVATDESVYNPPADESVTGGDVCETNVREDRLPRKALPPIPTYTSATTLYQSDFSTDPLGAFRILNGTWLWENNQFAQAHDCGFDTTSALPGYYVDNYRFEANFSSIVKDNHGGLLLNQSSVDTRSGASLVDLAEGGNVLRWGYYDDLGYYQLLERFEIERPAVNQAVNLAVEVSGTDVSIFYNGVLMGEVVAPEAGGFVGLVVNATPVAFHSVSLVALPS